MLSEYGGIWDDLGWEGEDGVTVNSLGDFMPGLRDPVKRAQVRKCLQDQVLTHTAADAAAAQQSWKDYSELAFASDKKTLPGKIGLSLGKSNTPRYNPSP
eukprot:3979945-Pyramimonas_sp.AAC.1